MKKMIKKLPALILLLVMLFAFSSVAYAQSDSETTVEAQAVEETEDSESSVVSTKALAAGIAIMGVAGIGAVSMAFSIGKSVDAISRQPEAEGGIRTSLMLGLVFIETAIIYALIVAILIVFVL